MTEPTSSYDALLIVSFGGPDRREDVLPFLENVLRGRNVPRERMLEVAEHYYRFGGKSPINDQNRALVAAIERELNERGPTLPVYWGNRNWHPLLVDTLRQMSARGVKRALALFTTAYSSYSSCRQYRENVADAQVTLAAEGVRAPQIDKLRAFFNHPGFIGPMVANTRAALEKIPAERRPAARIAFTAHSIPQAMAGGCRYETQLQEASRLIVEGLGHTVPWRLVFQSRSGPPTQPWLEPDICQHLVELAHEGVRDLVVVPVGFVSDHLEVMYDLDVEAQQTASELRVNMIRAATVGTHPDFIAMIRELIVERMTPGAVRPALGTLGASHDVCPIDCCLSGRPAAPPASASR